MKKLRGFSLIEMLLVLVIIGSFIYMGTNYFQQKATQARIDKSVMDMQQILNAAMAYYVANGSWPNTNVVYFPGTIIDDLSMNSTEPNFQLFRTSYLPKAAVGNMKSPWGAPYYILVPSGGDLFYVYAQISTGSHATSEAYAGIISSRLPQGYVSDRPTSTGMPPSTTIACTASNKACYAVAMVNIPGQNLNNATAVNFVGLFHHGACIPKPQCPVDATGTMMTPQVFVVPVSISGVNNPNDNATVYPISSFTAYTMDAPVATPTAPAACTAQQTNLHFNSGRINVSYCDGMMGTNANGPAATGYWRACVQVITEKGNVSVTRATDVSAANYWGQTATVAAYTRCAPPNETGGSTFIVYGN